MRCPHTGRKYSSRCFQAVQRFTTMQMLLERAGPYDLGLVSDVDEIARPEVLANMVGNSTRDETAGSSAAEAASGCASKTSASSGPWQITHVLAV